MPLPPGAYICWPSLPPFCLDRPRGARAQSTTTATMTSIWQLVWAASSPPPGPDRSPFCRKPFDWSRALAHAHRALRPSAQVAGSQDRSTPVPPVRVRTAGMTCDLVVVAPVIKTSIQTSSHTTGRVLNISTRLPPKVPSWSPDPG